MMARGLAFMDGKDVFAAPVYYSSFHRCLALAAAVLYGVMNALPNAFAASTFGFSLVAASFALLTCSALSPGSVLNRLRVPGAASLALWSYAVYLAHKPVFMALRPELLRRGIDPGAPLTIAAVMAAGILGGWVLYRVVETPFMQLRARWYPAGAPTAPCRAAPVPVSQAVGG